MMVSRRRSSIPATLPCDAVDDHFKCESQNHDCEDGAERAHSSVHENLGAEQRAERTPSITGMVTRGSMTAAEVNAGTGAAVTPIMKLLVVVETLKGIA